MPVCENCVNNRWNFQNWHTSSYWVVGFNADLDPTLKDLVDDHGADTVPIQHWRPERLVPRPWSETMSHGTASRFLDPGQDFPLVRHLTGRCIASGHTYHPWCGAFNRSLLTESLYTPSSLTALPQPINSKCRINWICSTLHQIFNKNAGTSPSWQISSMKVKRIIFNLKLIEVGILITFNQG